MSTPPRHNALNAALAALFAGDGGQASWFSLPAGQALFAAGAPADTLYLLQSGRLGVFRREDSGERVEMIGVVRSGEPVGEMAMVAGTAHTATVVALRDSDIAALPRHAFLEAARSHPEIMTELARLMLARARAGANGPEGNHPNVIGFISLRPRPIRALVERISTEIQALGFTCQVIDQSALSSAAEWFSRVEDAHDFVLYVAEQDEPAWRLLCMRQVDRQVLVGDALATPGPDPLPEDARSPPLEGLARPRDLILLRPATLAPQPPGLWLDAFQPVRWFHVREGHADDARRMARLISGTSVGLVLSGGGARAYAHLGAIRALVEHGMPIDLVGGASMGAVMAAGLALEWSQDELDERIHSAFVEQSPLDDIALPLVAMTRGHKVDALLEEHFGEVDTAALAIPYFCVSTDLTNSRVHVHTRGRLRTALRASISLPGVLPPVIEAGAVLVDGAVIKSFPSEMMRQRHRGPVVGVDVSRARGVAPELLENRPSWWRWVLSGAWRKGPPIVSILMRSATISTAAELAVSRKATDLLILPKLDGVEIRDWDAFDPAVAAGYAAATEALAGLEGPLTHLNIRRREQDDRADDAALNPVAPPETGAKTASGRRRRDRVEKRP